MFAIIRVRGKATINKKIENTMELLNLTRANHCVLYDETDKIKGMLFKIKDYVTWGEISEDVLEKLLLKRGKLYKDDKSLVKLCEVYKDQEIKDISSNILSGKVTLKKLNIKPVFRLRPPKKGYDKKGIKKTYVQGGTLGYRSKNINLLLKKMM